MPRAEPRVFTIPVGVPFLPTLADALVDGRLAGRPGADLSRATIYLPTRRAARAFVGVLADRVPARAQLLPRIVPLGEIEEADADLPGPDQGGAAPLLPPIPALERRLVLTRLVQRWSREVDRRLLRLAPGDAFLVPSSPADAVNLAGDLEALMDAFATEDVPWEALGSAIDGDYSRYFEITRQFVEIAAANWPKILEERRAADPARRRVALIAAEAERLRRTRPDEVVVAAGSTGSIPATADLLAAIARLPAGAVVLPGLDTHLDEEGWGAIEPGETDGEDRGDGRAGHPVHGHPQASLNRLLRAHLGCGRSSVQRLGNPTPTAAARARLLSEALRPAETTERWAVLSPPERGLLVDRGCRGLAIVEAAEEREEALALALALRETLAEPDRTAALVTPDRALAARVAIELQRWGIAVEDSAGLSLAETPLGRLARLAADAAADDFRPARLLALLAHPDVRLGLPREIIEQAASVLEIGVLRGPSPGPGLGGVIRALNGNRTSLDQHQPRPRKRLTPAEWDLAAELLARLEAAFRDFSPEARGEAALDLVALAADHRRAVELLTDPGEEETREAGDGAAAEGLAALFDDLAFAGSGAEVEGRFAEYPQFFAQLARDRTVRAQPRAAHRRLTILGLLEARLLSVDRVVLGGLDEAIWPPRTETDAFLNRPMRARIGLSSPERRIGQTAHDFVQALGAGEVVISRAVKREGKPTVPSRFLQRLKAFAGEQAWSTLVARGDRYRKLAGALESRATAKPLARPAPRPGPDLFPRALSVTQIETLVRDPYAIFARHVLKLDPLASVAAAPGPSERGTIVHDALALFAAEYPEGLPEDPLHELRRIGLQLFLPLSETAPELSASWWPRFETFAVAYVAWESKRRADLARVLPERSGALPITLPDGSVFTLRARADRIEERRDGGFAIVDFKTGQVPSNKAVAVGFSPQLTLEAAMLMRGGFRELPAAAHPPQLLYVRAAGGRNPLCPQDVKPPSGDGRRMGDIVEEHLHQLTRLLAAYASGEAGYLSRPYPQYAKSSSDYDHLARVREWSMAGDAEAEAPA